MAEYTKPLPIVDNWNRPYWAAAREHRLIVQECAACRALRHPPGPVCPNCQSPLIGWREMSGQGRIWSWVRFHQNYFPGFADEIPYNVVMIELAEGPFLVSNLVDLPPGRDPAVGDAVSVVFDAITPEFTLPKFRLADPAPPGPSRAAYWAS